jgi:FtsP/CotA-like multicopper oxidase with cupredoxin domain
MDGHPRFAINPGEEFAYEFVIRDRAATYWFHPHSHGNTATQVYRGLAGLLLVADDEEDAIGLPTGDYDLPIVIQDRMFDGSNQLVYASAGMMMDGFLGNTILVNGQPDYQLPVATRVYRLRLLNGSNSRTYKLAWDDSTPLVVIATDGGLLERPVQRDYVTLAPGERIDVWADFSRHALGDELTLRSLVFEGADSGMMMGGHGGFGVPANGAALDIMRVRVDREESEDATLPDALSNVDWPAIEQAANAQSPRTFSVSFLMHSMMGGQWGFDGRTFELNGVDDHELIPFNTLEVWEFINQTAPVVMNHPIHIHGAQFQVIERRVDPDFADEWGTVSDGYVDEGWKDTVLLMPGERAKILIRFEDYAGRYLYHCHNLEHADAGMMRNLRVQ